MGNNGSSKATLPLGLVKKRGSGMSQQWRQDDEETRRGENSHGTCGRAAKWSLKNKNKGKRKSRAEKEQGLPECTHQETLAGARFLSLSFTHSITLSTYSEPGTVLDPRDKAREQNTALLS